jgi:Kef-type K+ transport system membrane component KefB/nucleotide-binding universal stress UspA family protein
MAAAADPIALLLVQATVIIAVSRLLGWALRRIGQPMVIAEVVAGIILGPSLLGLFWPEVMQRIFPAGSLGNLGILSQVGLVFFMFLIGLELDSGLLRGRGRASVIISHASIVLPFGVGAALAFYLYPRLGDPGVRFSPFLLFIGIAMSITAFPVLAGILSERRITRTRMGAMTLACAAVDDVTAWCLLAFVVAIAKSTSLTGAVLTIAWSLAYILAMLLLVRPLLRRIADSVVGREGLNQNLVAATFLLVLLSAYATERIGIHPLFGAFLAGAIMPRQHGLAHALAEKIEDLVVIVLLPLFFAFSGLRTQIGLLDTSGLWAMCGLIVLAACLAKFGGGTLAARLTGMSWRESSALGILMNTRGLIELIVLNLGLDLGVISPTLFTMLVIMALVTTFMTSPLLHLIYPPRLLAQDSLDREPGAKTAEATPAASETQAPPFSLLACVGEERSGPAMAAIAIALGPAGGSRTTALHLIPPPERSSEYVPAGDNSDPGSGDCLEAMQAAARGGGLEVRPITFVSHDPGEDICQVAEAKGVDLILLGWHKALFNRALLSGTVGDVLARASCDVAVVIDRGIPVPEQRPRWPERVLVPYCGTEHDRTALAIARRLYIHRGCNVVVLHVIAPGHSSIGTAEQALGASFPGERGGVVMKVVPHPQPVEAVLEEAATGYDLVVIGIGPTWGLGQRHFDFQPERLIDACPTSLLVGHRARVVEPAPPPARTMG